MDKLDRQCERDEFAQKIMTLVNALRKDVNWDARGADKIEITIPSLQSAAIGGVPQGQPMAIVHSRIHPSYPFTMANGQLEAALSGDNSETEE